MICFDRVVTIFSFNGKGYDRQVFDGVSVFGGDGIEPTDSGFKQSCEYKVRILSEDEIAVSCGDRIVFENTDVFEAEMAYTIMKIKDNRKGNIKHYLLVVK